jgi:hypothetical protein
MMAMHVAKMKVPKFIVTTAKIIWRMQMSKMIIATKIMSKVIMVVAMGSMVVVNFIPSFSFLMSMATITSIATRVPSLMNLLDLLQEILERNGYLSKVLTNNGSVCIWCLFQHIVASLPHISNMFK